VLSEKAQINDTNQPTPENPKKRFVRTIGAKFLWSRAFAIIEGIKYIVMMTDINIILNICIFFSFCFLPRKSFSRGLICF
jgi:hypothetical protein